MAIGVSYDFFELELITQSDSADIWGPMAVAVIFGLVFATVLTLVVAPTLYYVLDWFSYKLFGFSLTHDGVDKSMIHGHEPKDSVSKKASSGSLKQGVLE